MILISHHSFKLKIFKSMILLLIFIHLWIKKHTNVTIFIGYLLCGRPHMRGYLFFDILRRRKRTKFFSRYDNSLNYSWLHLAYKLLFCKKILKLCYIGLKSGQDIKGNLLFYN